MGTFCPGINLQQIITQNLETLCISLLELIIKPKYYIYKEIPGRFLK